MPFLLIAVLIVAAIANPLAGARAAPPGELSRHAGAQAVPIAPAGGIGALRRAADPDHGQVTRPPTRHVGVIPAAASDAPGVVAEDTASPPRPENDILIPLAPKTRESADTFGPEGAMPSSDEQRARGRSTWIATTVGALGIALGAFLLLAWMVRRSVPAAMRPLPSDVVEVLGRAPLIGRQQLHMLRFANKLVLISTTQSGETITLAEIEDTDEVNRVVALCRRHDASSSSESFRRLLQQFGQEPDDARFGETSGARSTATLAHAPRKPSEKGTT